ncbi:MAG: hypothetical protein Ta2B_16280 [Termitinemataceae bacterium]|nr:MAG: hypothetical protein Ta2B_16280 [Termitinemataceae bacterium]
MQMYDYSEMQKNIETIFNASINDDVVIIREDGCKFKITSLENKQNERSPLDISGIDTDVTMNDILESIRGCRERQ